MYIKYMHMSAYVYNMHIYNASLHRIEPCGQCSCVCDCVRCIITHISRVLDTVAFSWDGPGMGEGWVTDREDDWVCACAALCGYMGLVHGDMGSWGNGPSTRGYMGLVQ